MWGRSLCLCLFVAILLLSLADDSHARPHRRTKGNKRPRNEREFEREREVEKRFLGGLTSSLRGVWSGLTGGVVEEPKPSIKPETVPVEEESGGVLHGITDLITGHHHNTTNHTDHGLLEGIGEVIEEVTEDIGETIDEVTDEISEAWQGLTEGVMNKVHNITETLEKAIDSLDMDLLHIDLSDLANDVLGSVTNMTLTPIKFLQKYGYLPDSADEFRPLQVVKALLNFQHMYSVSLSGIFDLHSLEAMLQPRCGMKDIFTQVREGLEGLVGKIIPGEKRGIVKRNNIPGYKWSKKDLTWKIHNYYQSSEMPPETQRRALAAALNYWQQVSGLTFREVTGEADLNIHFYGGDHGDGSQNAFDGSSGVLAHAFYPMSGEAHFDTAERFTDETTVGVNLKIVAAHEFGHALGLAHSDVKGALMAPYYQGFEPNYKLPADDIQGIQKLYGSRDGSVAAAVTDPPTTTTTQRSIVPAGSPPDTCTVSFRAITQTHDYRIYAYNGRWMWRMSEYGLDDGFPVTIDSYYEYAPSDIEAALFSRDTFYTYFFKGKSVWVYYGFQLVDQRTITTSGYPSYVQAALTTPSGQICIIQGTYCWIFNEDTLNAESGTPRKLSDVFPGTPYLFDSAVRLDGESDIFFFYGTHYYRYRESTRSVVSGYPKPKAGPWMGPACGAPPYTPK